MATTLGNALDKTDDVTDRLDPSLTLPPGVAIAHFAVRGADGNFYFATAAEAIAVLLPPPLPVPAAPTFTSFQDTNAGGSVVLVPATGTVAADYLYQIGATGLPQPVPTNGVIVVGNIDGSVYAYLPASGTHAQGATATSPVFTSYTAPIPKAVLMFPAIGNKKVGDLPSRLNASSTNTVTPITYASSNPSVLEVRLDPAGWVAEPLAAGTATATAYQVAGNGYNAASPVGQAVTVSAVATPTPVITMPSLPTKQAGDAPFSYVPTSTNTVTAITLTSSNTNVATVSGTTITVVGAGSYTITANQAAGNGYAAGSNTQVGTVTAVPVNPTFGRTLAAEQDTANNQQYPYNRDTLTWSANNGWLARYNDPIQAQGTAPGSPMLVFFPDLDTQVGQLDFDPADAGKPCAFRNTLTSTDYYHNAQTGALLAFTSGNVLLAL